MNTSPNTRRAPFFVLGAQRSGTTLLRLMLNSHPRLSVPHESGFIVPFYRRLHEYGDLSRRGNAARLLDDIAAHPHVRKGGHLVDRESVLSRQFAGYAELVDALLGHHAASCGKARWGDKTPSYTEDIDILWQLFPGCKFIHLIRDGRDVALSQREIAWASRNLPKLAADWSWKTTICHKVGTVLGAEHFLEIHFEELVLDPERALRRVCEFIGEPFAAEMLRYHENAEAAVPVESRRWHRNSVQPPNPGKVHEWRHRLSSSDRIIFEQIAGAALDLFGYEREHRPGTLGSRLRNLYYATIARW